MSIRHLGKKKRIASEVEWEYEPTAKQTIAHRAPQRHKLYGGAVGGGKSWWLCAEAIRLSVLFPGNRGFLGRNYIKDFKDSTLVTFGKMCPPDLIRKHDRDARVLLFQNGSEILYGGLGGEGDFERIKSMEFGFFGIDEATEILLPHWYMLCSRLRWTLPDGTRPRYFGLLTCNPEPGWITEKFPTHDSDQCPVADGDNIFIRALPEDNPHNPKDYIQKLEGQYTDDWVRRYLKGSFEAFKGQIYIEFERARHVIEFEDVGSTWNMFRVIDHGYVNPTCCLWIGVDADGVMYIFDEHYESHLTVAENAKIIHAKHPGSFLTIADPSMFARTQQKGSRVWSYADEYRDHGIPLISPYVNSGRLEENLGINMVKQRLKSDMLLIHRRCENTLSEIVRWRWRDLKATSALSSNAPELPVDKDNHAMDCLRYACVYRPMEGQVLRQEKDVHWTTHYAKQWLAQQTRPQVPVAGWRMCRDRYHR